MRNFSSRLRAHLTAPAPRETHRLTAIIAGVSGLLFVYLGIALLVDAEWSRITRPVLVATICMVPLSIGAALLYAAWRILEDAKRVRSAYDS